MLVVVISTLSFCELEFSNVFHDARADEATFEVKLD